MVAKANRTLGMLKRTFESWEPGLWKNLYVSLVRLHLENAVQAWNCMETLTKLREYKERVPEFQLVLIETYKVLSNRESIDWVKPLKNKIP